MCIAIFVWFGSQKIKGYPRKDIPSGKIEFGDVNVVEFIKPKRKDFSQLMCLSQ